MYLIYCMFSPVLKEEKRLFDVIKSTSNFPLNVLAEEKSHNSTEKQRAVYFRLVI